jgi:F0F1-type ATP synthase gamma subunit
VRQVSNFEKIGLIMNVNKNTIKRKIKLTITTKKICEAMKLISAVRFKKSNNRFNKLKPYYEEVYKTFDYLLSRLNDSKYLSKPFSAQKCL